MRSSSPVAAPGPRPADLHSEREPAPTRCASGPLLFNTGARRHEVTGTTSCRASMARPNGSSPIGPMKHVLAGEAGESGWQLGPWVLKRAVRATRPTVDGLPEGFRFHDLRHTSMP